MLDLYLLGIESTTHLKVKIKIHPFGAGSPLFLAPISAPAARSLLYNPLHVITPDWLQNDINTDGSRLSSLAFMSWREKEVLTVEP